MGNIWKSNHREKLPDKESSLSGWSIGYMMEIVIEGGRTVPVRRCESQSRHGKDISHYDPPVAKAASHHEEMPYFVKPE